MDWTRLPLSRSAVDRAAHLRTGATVIEVNPVPSEVTAHAHIFLEGAAGEVLPMLLDTARRIHPSAG